MIKNNPFDAPEIALSYERWYLTNGSDAAAAEKALLRHHIEQFAGARSILEVGCGTGYFSQWMDGLDYDVYGLDLSRAMLSEAVKKKGVDCVLGDAENLPFRVNVFDLVVMVTTLEFISNPLRALSEAARVARQGVVLGVINRHSLLGLNYRRMGGPVWGTAKMYTPRELTRLALKLNVPRNAIIYHTTLWPIFPGSSRLLWGGFIVFSMRLFNDGGG